jgi:hypothetical protein
VRGGSEAHGAEGFRASSLHFQFACSAAAQIEVRGMSGRRALANSLTGTRH